MELPLSELDGLASCVINYYCAEQTGSKDFSVPTDQPWDLVEH